MISWDRPIILASKCLLEEKCRYDGQTCINKLVKLISDYVDFVLVCPEMEIGLTVPREPIRLVGIDDKNVSLIQPASNDDLTKKIQDFSKTFLNSLLEVDGVVLKTKSPTCGLNGVRVYKDASKGAALSKKGVGVFAKELIERFEGVPLEDEGRLTNMRIREHFLTKVFMLSNLRNIKKRGNIEELQAFHNSNELLLKTYGRHTFNILNGIIKNGSNLQFNDVYNNYFHWLKVAISKIPRVTSVEKTLNMCLNNFAERITNEELNFVRNIIDKYRNGRTSLSVPVALIKLNAIRFDDKYLLSQTFLEPYPEELVLLQDSGKDNNV